MVSPVNQGSLGGLCPLLIVSCRVGTSSMTLINRLVAAVNYCVMKYVPGYLHSILADPSR